MNIPSKVKIGGVEWKIIVTDLEKDHGHEIGQMGKMSTVDNTIYLNTRTSRQNQESTLLHEIIHVISHNNNLSLSEQLICILEAGFYQVIKDNPEIFKKIYENKIMDMNEFNKLNGGACPMPSGGRSV